MLLAAFRREIAETEDGWTMDSMIESPSSPLIPMLISNLQCTDIELLNDVDVVPVLGHYVRERRALGLVTNITILFIPEYQNILCSKHSSDASSLAQLKCRATYQ